MSVTYPTKLFVAFRSGDRCAFPACKAQLTVDGETSSSVVIGEAAHIAGENEGSARYDCTMTDEQRNHHTNLIYMCGNHHTQIDKQEDDYPCSRLLQMKAEHEIKVNKAIVEAFAIIGFPELEIATRWILQVNAGPADQDFSLIPPEDKIKKNELGLGSRKIITMGLSIAHEIQRYIESISQTEADFPDRLKAGFLSEYYRLKHEGHRGDMLFDLMCQFSQRGFNEQASRSAGMAVLIYLFESCEVFEK